MTPDALDTKGQMPLCMFQFKRLFGSSRVPGEAADALVTAPAPTHVVVFVGGHAYALTVLAASGEQAEEMAALEAVLEREEAPSDRRLLGPARRPIGD